MDEDTSSAISEVNIKIDAVMRSLRFDVGKFDEPVRAPAFVGIGDLITHGVVRLASSAAPADPASGDGVIWMDSTSGDLKCKLNLGGTTKTATLADWSAL